LFAQILLYVSLFAFGYMTCVVFYFGKSINFYFNITKISLLLSLFIIVRSLEHLTYAKEIRIKAMNEVGNDLKKMKLIQEQFDKEMNFMKTSFSSELKKAQLATPYHMHFSDWNTAMKFLDSNSQAVKNFINKYKKQNNKGG
jgi:hypothetical protein